MHGIKVQVQISGSHKLDLDYESKCTNLHGHNWDVTIYVKSKELDQNGMVIDFSKLKKCIHDRLDHKHINDVVPFNPTAENLAKWIADEVNLLRSGIRCYMVEVAETDGNTAMWWED